MLVDRFRRPDGERQQRLARVQRRIIDDRRQQRDAAPPPPRVPRPAPPGQEIVARHREIGQGHRLPPFLLDELPRSARARRSCAGAIGPPRPMRSQRRSASRSRARSRPTRARNTTRCERRRLAILVVGVLAHELGHRRDACRCRRSGAAARARVMRAPSSACRADAGGERLAHVVPERGQARLARCIVHARPGLQDVQDVLVERVGLRGRALVEPDAGRPLGDARPSSAPTSRARRRACGGAGACERAARAPRARARPRARRCAATPRSSARACRHRAAARPVLQRVTPRRMRSGSSRNAGRVHGAQHTPARRSSRPPKGSIHVARAHIARHRVDREVAALRGRRARAARDPARCGNRCADCR